MFRTARLVVPALVCVLPSVGSGRTWHVNPDGSGDAPTIQVALDGAAPGDTVALACGTYHEHDIRLATGVTLRGESGDPSCVTLDAGGLGRVLHADRIGTARVSGLTVTGGRTEGEWPDGLGGGVLSEGTVLEIERCVFAGNSANKGGGACFLWEGGVVSESTFRGNDAIQGSAVNCWAAEASFEACRFVGNVALEGAVACIGAAPDFAACAFDSNVATYGGALFGKWSNAGAEVTDCTFTANEATDGGALLFQQGDVFVTRSAFVANRASAQGGAVHLDRTGCTLRQCTVVRNATGDGGVMFSGPAAILTLDAVILASSEGAALACDRGRVTIRRSDLFGNAGGDWTGCAAGLDSAGGNFSADPDFCDPDAGDFRVTSGSPLLPEHNEGGILIGAFAAGCDVRETVIQASAVGVSVIVDGVPRPAPVRVSWLPGSSHTIGAPSNHETPAGRRDEFVGWSDGGDQVHGVIAPADPAVFRAGFRSRYHLDMQSGPGGSTTPETGWYDAWQPVAIVQTADPDYRADGWLGVGTGAYTGPDRYATVTMQGPVAQVARFTYVGNYPLTVLPDSGGTAIPASGDFPAGSTVQIRARQAPGFLFDDWIGEGDGAYSGPDSVALVTMLGPITQRARFHYEGFHPLTVTAVGSGTIAPASGDRPARVPVEIYASPAPGWEMYRWVGEGPGAYTGTDWAALVTMEGPTRQTAYFAEGGRFPLSMTWSNGGSVHGVEANPVAGSTVELWAIPEAAHRFVAWEGTGEGSYSGPEPRVSITMHGPVTQHATFEPDGLETGYELSISASATDPHENASAPSGGLRPLFLWMTCGDRGISALEAGTTGSLTATSFTPAGGALCICEGDDLLVAVPDCAQEPGTPVLLGWWLVEDDGGDFCLAPSARSGTLAVVDCSVRIWDLPGVTGFSSTASEPCRIGVNTCDSDPGTGAGTENVTDLRATAVGPQVELTWDARVPGPGVRFHVYRAAADLGAFTRRTEQEIVGEGPYRYVDTGVEPDCEYVYRIEARYAFDRTVEYGPVSVRTLPVVATTDFAPLSPSPLTGTVDLRFSLETARRVRLLIYDVGGRLVRTVLDAERDAGHHTATWDGRDSGGRTVARGMYFFRMEAGDVSVVRKSVFLGR